MMDFQTFQIPIIFGGIFVLACVVLSFVYKFGMKEISYEEALAEQRQIAQNILGPKPKPKEKKNKKANKKKEKQSEEEKLLEKNEEIEKDESTQSEKEEPIKVVKNITAPLPVKEVVEIHVHKKKGKSQSPKESPKEEKPQIKKPEELLSKNTKSVPKKDEHDAKTPENKPNNVIKHTNSVESNIKKVTINENPKIVTKSGKTVIEKVDEVVEKIRVENVQAYPMNGNVLSGKEKKKKKSEYNQHIAEKEALNINSLLNEVRKAEISRQDIQILIDLLLNKQHEVPATLNEWSEGKSDPLVKLKKQLAEKEKALTEETEALLSAQAKLREIRSEQNAERSQLLAKIRTLEELVESKKLEVQQANQRYHAQAQSLQQVQMQLNDECIKSHSLGEKLGGMQMQCQQMEMHLGQMQENDAIINQLRMETSELQSRNQQLLVELQQLGHIREQLTDLEQAHLLQINTLKKEVDGKNRQMEDMVADTQGRMDVCSRNEDAMKHDISRLTTALNQHAEELRGHELHKVQLQEQLRTVQKQKDDANKTIAQLKQDIQALEKEKTQTNGTIENNKADQVEILNLHNEISSIKSQLKQSETKYKSELDSSSGTITKLQKELDEQKAKNNELRTKNWKVMEALNVAESRTKTDTAPSTIVLDKLKSDILKTEEDSQKEFLKRLFPEIEELKSVNSQSNWQDQYTKCIKQYLSSLQSKTSIKELHKVKEPSIDVTELENMVEEYKASIEELKTEKQHYKASIDESVIILHKLQTQIEEEEINWRKQLKDKDLELDSLRKKLEEIES